MSVCVTCSVCVCRCKEVLRTHQERSTQLGSENEALQQQLQERLQELEKTKVGPAGCGTV